ncbi:MAG: tRNA guanosine(15) transglycosylase TgtA [Sulfolobales archaeon]|nr:tRNA guanosine(15) transglycosylase TgtA [Sulfolobales archaeon]MCX8185708.1 tRNA guanosine(15) transglycosylase TgtA [Sulfolobales archaeon]MDW7969651.1 tRNA guanosine(15) transglycosylase TgtA [Sulfolobales archaeon]
MVFEVRDKDLAGRIGKLVTKSGSIETPAFFPVVNPLRQSKEVSVNLLRDLGFTQLITNAYIIMKNLGHSVSDIHDFLGFDGVVMTDSGAYQLLRYGDEKVKLDPVEIVKFQESIGSDIAVIADIPTRDNALYEEALHSVEETLRRAAISSELVMGSKTLWVLPIQGGTYLDLVSRCATVGKDFEGFSIYAIGSPVLLMEKYDYSKVFMMVLTTKRIVPIDKPVHLFGAGHPMIIPFAVALGVDMFDSASYILYARGGRYMTERGTYLLRDLDYLPCECPICSRYDVGSLIDMDEEERTRNLALHNLYVILREIKNVKVAIREGRLWELLEERARGHPSLRYLLKLFTRKDFVNWFEVLDPRIRGDSHALFLYDETSYYRPEIIRHERFLSNYISRHGGAYKDAVLIPLFIDGSYNKVSKKFNDLIVELGVSPEDTYAYIPFFTLIPTALIHTYPYSHFKLPDDVDVGTLLRFSSKLRKFIGMLVSKYRSVTVVTWRRCRWASEAFIRKSLINLLDGRVIKLVDAVNA